MPRRYFLRGLLFGLLITIFSPVVVAQGLQVSPISLSFQAKERVQSLRLGNLGDRRMQVQIEVMRWEQAAGQDQLSPSRDIIATPPMLELDPQSRETVRIGRRQLAQQSCEATYRVIVTEIPSRENRGTAPVQFRTRMILPLFIHSAPECPSRLAADIDKAQLRLQNQGMGHIRLNRLWLQNGESTQELHLANSGYILAGADQSLKLPEGISGHDWQLWARQGKNEFQIPLHAAERR